MQRKTDKNTKKEIPAALKLDDDILNQINGGVANGKNNPGGNNILKPKR